MNLKQLTIFLVLGFLFSSCNESSDSKEKLDRQNKVSSIHKTTKGKLFIIGGGKRPPELIRELIKISQIEKKDAYSVILPMSSAEPDSAIYYARKQFLDLGIDSKKIKGFNFKKDSIRQEWIDSLRKANLIYISGGDQNKFMEIVLNTPIYQAMHDAYGKGATIAGTSAGAAVMSEKMITGNERKHPEYTGNFRSIEAKNIEIAKGMGFLQHAIIDQHFIKRMRMNRLLSVAIENPNTIAIGIDESTALIVEADSARVSGNSQVILIKNRAANLKEQNGLLGADKLELSVKLPGSKFKL